MEICRDTFPCTAHRFSWGYWMKPPRTSVRLSNRQYFDHVDLPSDRSKYKNSNWLSKQPGGIATGYGMANTRARVLVPVGWRILSPPCRPDQFLGPPSKVSCHLVDRYHRYRTIWCLHFQSRKVTQIWRMLVHPKCWWPLTKLRGVTPNTNNTLSNLNMEDACSPEILVTVNKTARRHTQHQYVNLSRLTCVVLKT
jgi:hypothetical protein